MSSLPVSISVVLSLVLSWSIIINLVRANSRGHPHQSLSYSWSSSQLLSARLINVFPIGLECNKYNWHDRISWGQASWIFNNCTNISKKTLSLSFNQTNKFSKKETLSFLEHAKRWVWSCQVHLCLTFDLCLLSSRYDCMRQLVWLAQFINYVH